MTIRRPPVAILRPRLFVMLVVLSGAAARADDDTVATRVDASVTSLSVSSLGAADKMGFNFCKTNLWLQFLGQTSDSTIKCVDDLNRRHSEMLERINTTATRWPAVLNAIAGYDSWFSSATEALRDSAGQESWKTVEPHLSKIETEIVVRSTRLKTQIDALLEPFLR